MNLTGITDAERHDLITGIGLVHEQQRDRNGLDTDPAKVARLAGLEARLQALQPAPGERTEFDDADGDQQL